MKLRTLAFQLNACVHVGRVPSDWISRSFMWGSNELVPPEALRPVLRAVSYFSFELTDVCTDVAHTGHSGMYATSFAVHPSRVYPRPRGRARTCRASTARASNSSSAAPSRYIGCKGLTPNDGIGGDKERDTTGGVTTGVGGPCSVASGVTTARIERPCLRSTSYAAAIRSHAECGSLGPPACLQSIPVYRNGDP